MAWKIEFDYSALVQLEKLGHNAQKQIDKYLRKIEKVDDPRAFGKSLSGSLSGFWRYRQVIIELFAK
ncbi:MAG TPA: hypothetical protein V6C96_05655 [Vampirovibrionales bacterium]